MTIRKPAPKPAPAAGKAPLTASATLTAKPTPATATASEPLVQQVPATIDVERHYPGGEDASETLTVKTFATKPGSVSVSFKQSLSDGNYGSRGVNVMVTLPAYVEEINEAFDEASRIAAERFATEMDVLSSIVVGADEAQDADLGAGGEGDAEAGDNEGEPEADDAGDGEGDALTSEEVDGYDADQLAELVEAYGGEEGYEALSEIDVKGSLGNLKGPKRTAKLAELREAIKAILFAEGDEEGAADGEDEAEAYTQESLMQHSPAELKEIWEAWGIPGKFPTGSVKQQKATAIARILTFQDSGA